MITPLDDFQARGDESRVLHAWGILVRVGNPYL